MMMVYHTNLYRSTQVPQNLLLHPKLRVEFLLQQEIQVIPLLLVIVEAKNSIPLQRSVVEPASLVVHPISYQAVFLIQMTKEIR